MRRYLKSQAKLYNPALAQLVEAAPPAEDPGREERLEEKVRLHDQRLGSVRAVLKASAARRVLDLGCGSGALLRHLLRDGYDRVVGTRCSAS